MLIIDPAVAATLTPQEIEKMHETDKVWSAFIGNSKPVWYRRLFPFLPIISYNKSLRLITFLLFDCSYSAHPITQTHEFDLLELNHRKWYHPKYVGFQVWWH